MQMLIEKHLHLLLVHLAHLLGRDRNDIPVLVGALARQPVDLGLVREAIAEHAEPRQVVDGDVAAGVVRFALVVLGGGLAGLSGGGARAGAYGSVVEPVCSHR